MVAKDLEAATEDLTAVLGISVCYRDPGVAEFGLTNIVAPVGGEFLEIVSTAEIVTSAGRYRNRRGGDSGYMVILQGEDTQAVRTRAEDMDVRSVWTYDEANYVATHFHPRDTGGILLSIDSVPTVMDHCETLCAWPPAGPDWHSMVTTERVSGLVGVEIETHDPAGVAKKWARLLDCHVEEGGDGALSIDLDNDAMLRFVALPADRVPGVSAVAVRAIDPDTVLTAARQRGLPGGNSHVEICGTRFDLV
jgi:hypothetical protein